MQSLKLEEKREGATFAAMLRRHRLDYSDSNDCVLKIVCVLNSTSFQVKQVKYFSVVLQVILSIITLAIHRQDFSWPHCWSIGYEGKGKKNEKEEEEMASVGLLESAIYGHIIVSTMLILN